MRLPLALLVLAALSRPTPTLSAEDSAGPADERRALLRVAERQRSCVVSVQVRAPGGGESRRQAVVVDPSGWLVLAGPSPGPKDTLAAEVKPQTYAPATVVARDAETALTLIQVLPSQAPLQAVSLPAPEPRRALPPPAAPGTALVQVTADGAVALGGVRARDRRRELHDGLRGHGVHVPGLLEAGLSVVASDLGAPWFDAEGRLVGLLVGGIVSDAEDAGDLAPGLALRPEPVAAHAVPAAVVATVWRLLESERSVRRSRLGVRARPGTEATLAHLCPDCGGHVIDLVEPGSPAERAGLERLDLIVSIEGSPLRRGAALGEALLPYRPLDTVRVRVLRRGQALEREVVLGAR